MSNPFDPFSSAASDAAPDHVTGEDDTALQGRLTAAGASWRRDIDARLPEANAFTLRLRQQIERARASQGQPGGAVLLPEAPSVVPINPSQVGRSPASITPPTSAAPNASLNRQRANARK